MVMVRIITAYTVTISSRAQIVLTAIILTDALMYIRVSTVLTRLLCIIVLTVMIVAFVMGVLV